MVDKAACALAGTKAEHQTTIGITVFFTETYSKKQCQFPLKSVVDVIAYFFEQKAILQMFEGTIH